MGSRRGLVTLWMSSNGRIQFIQAHPTEFCMGHRELWMGFWIALGGRSETIAQSRVTPLSSSTSAACRNAFCDARQARPFQIGKLVFKRHDWLPLMTSVASWCRRCSHLVLDNSCTK